MTRKRQITPVSWTVFPESRELKRIIERHDWTLYDVSNPPEGRAHSWKELSRMPVAEQYEINHNYFFVPRPKDGQTLRDSYAVTKGLGPVLDIKNLEDGRWLYLQVGEKPIGYVAFFSRLFFHPECAFVTAPRSTYLPNPDFVAMKYDTLIDTFQKHFRIVKPEELGLSAPIPMPFDPASN